MKIAMSEVPSGKTIAVCKATNPDLFGCDHGDVVYIDGYIHDGYGRPSVAYVRLSDGKIDTAPIHGFRAI